MSDKAFKSVWEAIEDDPAQATNMKHRSALMMEISEFIRTKGLNQTEAATMFGVSQPRISDLMRGKTGMFSIDTLVGMLAVAGIGIDIKVNASRGRKRTVNARRVVAKVGRRRVAA